MKRKNTKKRLSSFVDKAVANEIKKLPTGLGQIILKEIKDVDMCEMIMETDDNTAKIVSEIGRKLIKDDTEALFGYAVKKAMEDIIREEKSSHKYD